MRTESAISARIGSMQEGDAGARGSGISAATVQPGWAAGKGLFLLWEVPGITCCGWKLCGFITHCRIMANCPLCSLRVNLKQKKPLLREMLCCRNEPCPSRIETVNIE